MICKPLKDTTQDSRVLGVVIPVFQRRHALHVEAPDTYDASLEVRYSTAGEGSATCDGYFVWLSSPESPDSEVIAEYVKTEENLIFGYGTMFERIGTGRRHQADTISVCPCGSPRRRLWRASKGSGVHWSSI